MSLHYAVGFGLLDRISQGFKFDFPITFLNPGSFHGQNPAGFCLMDTDPIVFIRRVIRTALIVMAVAIEMSSFSTKHGLASQPVTVEGRILSQVFFPDLIPTLELFLGFLIQPLIDLGVVFKEIFRSPIDSFFVIVPTMKS
jgi:hypothetical protein